MCNDDEPGKITFFRQPGRGRRSFALVPVRARFMPTPPKPSAPGSSDRLRAVAKYSGLAFQMLATIGFSTWLGVWLDRRFQLKNPWCTIVLMLAGVFVALWQVIRSLTKES